MTDDLRFAGKLPVVINHNGDTRDIFAPIKSSSCDITIVSNRILSDLYTDDKKGIKVKVEKIWKEEGTQNNTLFEGYMTPNTYSQHLSPNLDTIDMTAVDPLSVLKYVYINDILEKSKTITMGELLAKALALVKIDCDSVWIEQTVNYKTDVAVYVFADLLVQTNNFWDEGDYASSVYDAISECLRLFGYTLTFTGEKYMVYLAIADHTFGETSTIPFRYFTKYRIEDGGYLVSLGQPQVKMEENFFKHSVGDWTTIDDNPTVSIDDTYDRISSVASTKIPNYSLTAFDMVSSEDRDKYDAGDLNLARNKIKGYNYKGERITDDEWYYIWNGVYINPYFGLEINGSVNGYANINNAYQYLSGQTGNPNASGSILNFYGSEDNPIGTSRDPQEERSVEVKECITVFAPDNGVAPEFLEREDLAWSYVAGYSDGDGENWYEVPPEFNKILTNPSKYGVNQDVGIYGISYSQKYENITTSVNAEQTLVIDLTQSYSRTGFKDNITISNYTDMENIQYGYGNDGDGENSGQDYTYVKSGKSYTYPSPWQSSSITVDYGYFTKYSFSGSISDAVLKEVWDCREVIVFIKLSNGTVYQFNGKEWVELDELTDANLAANSFWLKKLMNYKKIFGVDYKYDLIECADGTTFSLNEEGFIYYKHSNGGVYRDGIEKGTKITFKYYGEKGNAWAKYISGVSEGNLEIILPAIDSTNTLVQCDISHSTLLGTTGNKGNSCPSVYISAVNTGMVELTFAPVNATYIKAEHLNIDISLSVPETNLGQMFGESDIKYQTSHSKRFRQSWDAPNFLVNTKHQIVSQSHSYVIVGNALADPNKFSIGWSYNKLACRPENFVMQGYKNYWSTIRKIYNRVLVPHKNGFSNCMCFIEVPDLPDDGHGRWLVVVSDSVDVKTNRHTICAVEDYDMKVKEISNYTVIEIPRKARNDRYNLPSVKK